METSRRQVPVFGALLLTAIGVIGFAACASGAEDSGTPTQGAGGTGAIAGTGGAGGTGGGGTAGHSGTSGTSGKAGSSGHSGTSGTSTGGSSGSSGSSGTDGTGGTAGAGPGEFGSTCTATTDCNDGLTCADVGNASSPSKVCIQPCETGVGCPTDAHCTTIDSNDMCIPDRDSPCGKCTADTDCANLNDRCLDILDASGVSEQKFCAEQCYFNNTCPTGYDCKALMGGGSNDMFCYPTASATCPCAPNRNGEQVACNKESCTGSQTCDGASATLSECDAPEPGPCDANCDGTNDSFPNASCNTATGDLTCVTGFVQYPPGGLKADGCACKIDLFDNQSKGNTCDTSLASTALKDVASGASDHDSTTVSGTLHSDTDVDWFNVIVTDVDETTKNSMHVHIGFTVNPNNEFTFRVIRAEVATGAPNCTGADSLPKITDYDWSVNFVGPVAGVNLGEDQCGATDGHNLCANHTAKFVIGVVRADGATPSCSSYTLEIKSAAGPGTPPSAGDCP